MRCLYLSVIPIDSAWVQKLDPVADRLEKEPNLGINRYLGVVSHDTRQAGRSAVLLIHFCTPARILWSSMTWSHGSPKPFSTPECPSDP